MLKPNAGDAADPRAAARSNVFLTATLAIGRTSLPVRVRNISAGGALLDGPDLPGAGSIVRLRRGSLSTDGKIAWQERDQCGVRFSRNIRAEEWVRRVGHSGQLRVDNIVNLLQGPQQPNIIPLVLAHFDDSLKAISIDLTEACEQLANLPDLLAAHADDLLRLDAIAQRLRHFLESTHETL